MKAIAYSINGVPIRLTDERWAHIARNKPYMLSYRELVLETIERPTWVLRGYGRALIAIRSLGKGKYLHVVYREVSSSDGFILTAFIARKVNRKAIVWPKRS
jgi:hypothetical protein